MILKNNDAVDNGDLFSPDTIIATWGLYEHDVLWPLALGFTEEEIIRSEAEGGFGSRTCRAKMASLLWAGLGLRKSSRICTGDWECGTVSLRFG